ncbi:hypothetical protein [Streptomyces sp. NPDC051546]|uniref:hypothetical protein n=1 Tax=Streptomyces sp. NPDC051546 TaxID=3365655 RepID=UPI0037BA85F7
MNPLEVRYQLYFFLAGLARPASIVSTELMPPVAGQPVQIRLITQDPMGAERTYMVSVEEQ